MESHLELHLQLICDLHIVTTDQKRNRSHLESYIYIMYGGVKRKEKRKLCKLIFVFFPMVFTFSQLQDLFKISLNPFPNVLNRINLPASWFCLHPYQILPKALCLILSAAKHLCLVLCGQYKCEQPLVLLCLGRNCCPKMLHAGLHC